MSINDPSGHESDPLPRGKRSRADQPLNIVAIDNAFLQLRTVIQLTGFSKTTIYKLMKSGDFPRPVHMPGRIVRWRASDIRLWLEARGRLPDAA